MAVVKMTLTDMLQSGGQVDLAKLDATTDKDIRRHAREDGQNPGETHDDWFPSPGALRERLHVTQAMISRQLRIPIATWRNWEQGRVVPDPAAQALLTVLWRVPTAFDALQGASTDATPAVIGDEPGGSAITERRIRRAPRH